MHRLLIGVALASGILAQPVDFASEVRPILAARCGGCHSGASPSAGLRLNDGNARLREQLISRVTATDARRMPPSGEPLAAGQLKVLARWIAQGAGTASSIPSLGSRVPPLPESTMEHPVDRLIPDFSAKAPVSDAMFARRAVFDVWGIAPSLEQLKATDRSALVDSLLADREMYAGHWISFWNDLLRNDTRVYHGESKTITAWLHGALKNNMPYDEMVRQLVNPMGADGPEGFLIGVNWRGDVNASQLPRMQAAQNTAQVFLGVNLKCASCHDSFVNKYTLRQSYGMAALFAETPNLELVRCDAKTGRFTNPEFLFPELGAAPLNASLGERRAAAAQLFTSPNNGRLARTIVNRVWGRLFGQALVENVDDMDRKASNPDLLDWLSADFEISGYDLKHLLRTILTSRAYQLPSIAEAGPKFRGPLVRRITAEQFADTLSALTGEWRVFQKDGDARFVREWELKATPLSRALGRPIRDQVVTARPAESSTLQALELINGDTLAHMLRRGARGMLGTLPEPPASLYDSRSLRASAPPVEVKLNAAAKDLWLLVEDTGTYDPARTVAGWENLRIDGKPLAGMEALPLAKPVRVPIGVGHRSLTGRFVIADASRASDIGANVRAYIFDREPDMAQLAAVTAPPPADYNVQRNGLAAGLFLQLFGRAPTATERTFAEQQLKASGPDGLADLLWVLINSPEFQFVL